MSDQLSSSILERQFGPTDIEVLYQEGLSRVIRTKVSATGQVLELSQVSFQPAGISTFPEPHKEVKNGASIGKAFTAADIGFRRLTHGVHTCKPTQLPDEMKRQFDAEGYAIVVEVSILVGPTETPYADILEVYSPVVKWPESGGLLTEKALDRVGKFGALLHSIYTETMKIGGAKRNGSRSQVGETEGPVSQRAAA